MSKHTGKDNPNYRTGKYCTPHYCIDCHKKIDRDGRSVRCHRCNAIKNSPLRGKGHSEKSKRLIGNKSKLKWTPEFKKQFRKTMENNGIWIPENKLKPYALYCKQSRFKHEVFKFLPKKQIKLLNTYGLFNAVNNKGGVVRDHKFSRYSGFKLNIPPVLLRHPVNCEIIFHNANVSKAKKYHRYEDGDSISLNMLATKIKKFKVKWNEQDECLKIIKFAKLMAQGNVNKGL